MKQDLQDFVAYMCQLIESMGFAIQSRGESRSGSVYLVIRRPWMGRACNGLRVRLSDHLPRKGHVKGWYDVRSSRRSVAAFREYLVVKAKQGWPGGDASGGVPPSGGTPDAEAAGLCVRGERGRGAGEGAMASPARPSVETSVSAGDANEGETR